MPINLGDRVGELSFLRPDGSAVALTEFLSRPLVMVFLRHLA